MKEILFNLAMIDTLNYCRANNIDASGSHLIKYPRKYMYSLIQTETNTTLATVMFHKSQVPTHH